MSLFSRGSTFLSTINTGPKHRPPFEGFYIYILGILIGYWLSDLGILFVRPSLLPTQPPPMRPSRPAKNYFTDISRYYPDTNRNIFNEDGKIPPKMTADGTEIEMGGDPVLSQLPLKLEGTLVHSNPKKSVATVMLK